MFLLRYLLLLSTSVFSSVNSHSLELHQFLEIGRGEKIHYISSGQPDKNKPLILFLHGVPERAEAWSEYLGAFGEDHFAVAYTMRGTYPSHQSNHIDDFTIDQLTEDVMSVVEQLGYGDKKFSIVAHDWGAATAWRVAIKYPQRLKKIVVMSAPHPIIYARGYHEIPEHAQSMDDYIARIRTTTSPWTMEEVLADDAAWFQNIVFTPASGIADNDLLRALYVKTWTHNSGQTIQSIFNLYRAIAEYPPLQSVEDKVRKSLCRLKPELQVKTPVLLLYGKQDPYSSYKLFEELDSECSPNTTAVAFPQGDHWIHHRYKSEIIPMIKAFLR